MMLFSNFGSPFGDDGIDDIIDGIKNLETNFTIVYVWLYSGIVYIFWLAVISRDSYNKPQF